MAFSWVMAWPAAGAAAPTEADVAPLHAAPPPRPNGSPLEHASVRLERRGGLSPYRRASYAVIVRASTPVAYQTFDLVGYDEPLQRMSLLTWEEFETVWRRLPAEVLPSAAPPQRARGATAAPAGAAEWTLELTLGDQVRRHRWLGEAHTLAEPGRSAVQAIRDAVIEHTGPIAFRNVFVAPSRRGWVDIRSTPSARVVIDDRDTGERTPLQTYELPAGAHRLRLVDEDRGIDERYDFKVAPGVTTILDLDLR